MEVASLFWVRAEPWIVRVGVGLCREGGGGLGRSGWEGLPKTLQVFPHSLSDEQSVFWEAGRERERERENTDWKKEGHWKMLWKLFVITRSRFKDFGLASKVTYCTVKRIHWKRTLFRDQTHMHRQATNIISIALHCFRKCMWETTCACLL